MSRQRTDVADKPSIDHELIAQRVAAILAERMAVSTKKRITMAELCKLWGVSSRHVNRLIEKGDIKAICLSPQRGFKEPEASL